MAERRSRYPSLTEENLLGLASWNVSPEAAPVANSFDELTKLLVRAERGKYNANKEIAKEAFENIHGHFTTLHKYGAVPKDLYEDWVETYTETHKAENYVANIQTVGLFYKDDVQKANAAFNKNLKWGGGSKKLTRRRRHRRRGTKRR